MKKILYALTLSLVVVSGLLYANREIKNKTSRKSTSTQPSVAEKKAELKQWEATSDGIIFKKWEASPSGKKVLAGAANIGKSIKDYTNMHGVVTSLSLPPGSRLGFGVMVRINGNHYILALEPGNSGKNILNEFETLHSLKVNDTIIIRSHNVSYAPKYSYPIVAGDYIERAGKIIYKRANRKGGC